MTADDVDPGPRAATRRLPFDERGSQLLDLAEELFIRDGYAAVTMEDIARAARVSRPIVYRHFETKEGAYLACVRRARTRYQERLLARTDVADDPATQIRVGAETFFAMLEEDPGRWGLLFGSNAVLPGEFTAELGELRLETIRVIHDQLRRNAPDVPDLSLEAAAHAVSGIGERLGHWWVSRPDLSRGEVVDLYVELLTRLLGPDLPTPA